MSTRKSADGSSIPDDSIIGWLAHAQRSCKHGPPRTTTGLPTGITDTCTCGATTYKLYWAHPAGLRREWRYVKGKRP